MNIELLKKVRNRLRRMKHKEHFVMRVFVSKNECGTAACIGGHALLIAGYKPTTWDEAVQEFKEVIPPGKKKAIPIWEAARQALGLDETEAGKLFVKGRWPDQFREDNLPRTAADRIDHFIETDGQE